MKFYTRQYGTIMWPHTAEELVAMGLPDDIEVSEPMLTGGEWVKLGDIDLEEACRKEELLDSDKAESSANYEQENMENEYIEQENGEMAESDMQQWVDEIYQYAADLMVKQRTSPEETKQKLLERGLSADDADYVVEKLEQQIKKVKSDRASKDMLYGALWCIGGIIVTAISYSAATGGGTYIIAGGAIFWGAVQFFKGLFNRE